MKKLTMIWVGVFMLHMPACENRGEVPHDELNHASMSGNGAEGGVKYMQYQVADIVPVTDERQRVYRYYDASFFNGSTKSMIFEFIDGSTPPQTEMKVAGYIVPRPYGSPFQNYPKDVAEQKYYKIERGGGLGSINNPGGALYRADFSHIPGIYDVFIITSVLSPPEIRADFEERIGYHK